MSNIFNYIKENPQETQRLIGLEYELLQTLIQNAEQLHYQKQAALEAKKIRIIAGHNFVPLNIAHALTQNKSLKEIKHILEKL
jgi:hypothetical protein